VSLPPADEPGWVAVALLGKTRGNRGELTALALSGKPERYQSLGEVYLFREGSAAGERRDVEFTWFHQGGLVFKFRGVDSISDAERLVGSEVRVPIAERTPLEPGEFFQSELVGCQVIDRRTGESLGRVEGWEDSGGAGLLAVEGGLLVPFARSICVEIEPAARRIVVELPEGLKDLNRS
jgi:16S rRNA processing protein RimM